MFKHLTIVFLLILLVPIVSAANTTCPACPQPTPYIVYVTVTIPVPVPATTVPIPQPTQTFPVIYPAPTPPPVTPEPNLLTQLSTNTEYIVYAGLFLALIIGIIMMRKKQKKLIKKPLPTPIENDKYGNLYEEEDVYEPEPKPIIKKEEPKPIIKKPKKPKKPKSLLDQDFEF